MDRLACLGERDRDQGGEGIVWESTREWEREDRGGRRKVKERRIIWADLICY